jgi:hypothetical protein
MKTPKTLTLAEEAELAAACLIRTKNAISRKADRETREMNMAAKRIIKMLKGWNMEMASDVLFREVWPAIQRNSKIG